VVVGARGRRRSGRRRLWGCSHRRRTAAAGGGGAAADRCSGGGAADGRGRHSRRGHRVREGRNARAAPDGVSVPQAARAFTIFPGRPVPSREPQTRRRQRRRCPPRAFPAAKRKIAAGRPPLRRGGRPRNYRVGMWCRHSERGKHKAGGGGRWPGPRRRGRGGVGGYTTRRRKQRVWGGRVAFDSTPQPRDARTDVAERSGSHGAATPLDHGWHWTRRPQLSGPGDWLAKSAACRRHGQPRCFLSPPPRGRRRQAGAQPRPRRWRRRPRAPEQVHSQFRGHEAAVAHGGAPSP